MVTNNRKGTSNSQCKGKTVFLLFYPKCTKMFVRVEFFICQVLPSFRTSRTLFCKGLGVGVFLGHPEGNLCGAQRA